MRDLDSLLDHLLIIDGKHLLLNDSVTHITEHLCFDELRSGEQVDEPIVSTPSLGGYRVISRNTSGRETVIDLETFFNAVLDNREQIINALKD